METRQTRFIVQTLKKRKSQKERVMELQNDSALMIVEERNVRKE